MKIDSLTNSYDNLKRKYGWDTTFEATKISAVIRDALSEFMSEHESVAIYCNGYHTRMLMADFMFEIKNIKYIVDNYVSQKEESGFSIITENDLEANKIDGVIISSYDYMDSITAGMKDKHPQVDCLNIYAELEKEGIPLRCAYYEATHPYCYYQRITGIQNKISEGTVEREQLYFQLVGEYVSIKDFRTAKQKAIEWGNHDELVADLEELYKNELAASEQVSRDNVVMLCIDGLRRADISEEGMSGLYRYLQRNSMLFLNTYSYSTSTYESLVPAYSGNCDMKTGYYNHNSVNSESCAFIKEAKSQHREVFFYTDMAEYVEDDIIHRKPLFQTATEKIWDFLVDASECKKGLFLIHILYESHFSFANPYTKGNLLSEGTAMLFDFLKQKGGSLRADYIAQHRDAIRYLDDVVTPFVERLGCPFVIFADHGNILLDKDTKLADVDPQYLTCHEDWVRIPFAVSLSGGTPGIFKGLFSLMSLNDVVVSLMQDEGYKPLEREWIKIGRSEIYNPDFRRLYTTMNEEKRLLAFEGFVFDSGEKLVVYADGTKELYRTCDDSLIEDDERLKILFQKIEGEVTVC